MSKEYGFPFNADMVRAMLDGRKTMTRRIPSHMNCIVDGKRVNKEFWTQLDIKNGTLQKDLYSGELSLIVLNLQTKLFHDIRPIYKPGDGLWVRENGWERPFRTDKMIRDGADTWLKYYYDADLTNEDHKQFKVWGFKRRPSIHMPRWASRISGIINSVSFNFLHDISEEDVIKEGVIPCKHFRYHINTSTCSFRILWDSIYGKTEFAWKENYPVILIGLNMEVQQK